MANPYNYSWEKLFQATNSLCGPRSQSERLKSAVKVLNDVRKKAYIPEEIREDFFEFMERMKVVKHENPRKGAIETTIDTFSDEEVKIAAEQIVHFYNVVCRYYYSSSD